MKAFATFIILTTLSLNIMAQQKIVQTAGRTQLGEFAPEFAHLNDDILFGEVWSRNDLLSLRDRSLVTITSLISQGITDSSLKYHLQSAKNNGITRTEAAEIITHIAFYAGWPKAWAAFNLAKEVWSEDVKGDDAKAAFQREMIFPIGEPNTAYAKSGGRKACAGNPPRHSHPYSCQREALAWCRKRQLVCSPRL